MSGRASTGDVSFLLLLVPFVASGVYALFLWVQEGISLLLPSDVYLTVTRDPYLFILGSLAVMLGATLQVRSSEPGARGTALLGLNKTLQSMAVASLILVLLSAVYANGFDLAGAASDFIVGRYGIVFPAMLFLLSYLVTIRLDVASVKSTRTIGIVLLLLVPVSLYYVGRRIPELGLGGALLLLVAGVALILTPRKSKSSEP